MQAPGRHGRFEELFDRSQTRKFSLDYMLAPGSEAR
jgi:hypothetical protein